MREREVVSISVPFEHRFDLASKTCKTLEYLVE